MRENRAYHDRIAARYDQIYDSEYWRFYRDLSWRHLKTWLPTSRPALAADLGCGTGWFGKRLLRAGFSTVFLDPSISMLEQARQKVAAEAQRSLESRFVQAGLEDMAEIDDNSIDFATAQGDPLSFCADPDQALAELHRILRVDAVAVLSVDNRCAGVRTLLEEESLDEALELLRTGRTEWRAQRPEERFGMKMFDVGELETLLQRRGFAIESQIGKTCVIQRRHQQLLADKESRKRCLQAELSVHHKPHWWAFASHLQFTARKLG